MGILNINDDSFCGDGRVDTAWALSRASELASQGADIIDLGAESAGTNRAPISEQEEIDRVCPVLEQISAALSESCPAWSGQVAPPWISVNTWRPAVAKVALSVGGEMLNDMSGLPSSENAKICARAGASLLIMHLVGAPKQRHTHISYADVVDSLERFFEEKIAIARCAGLAEEGLVLDPGLDFAKQREDNLRIMRGVGRLAAFRRPILLPVSRKTFIGSTLGIADPRERDAGTVATIVAGARRGAAIFRVHNVVAARQALAVLADVGIIL